MLDQPLNDKKRSNERFNSKSLLLKIVIYYEQGAYRLLDSFVYNTKRSLKRKETLLDFEYLFTNFMYNLMQKPKSKHRAAWCTFRQKLQELVKTAAAHEKEFLLSFNYMAWLNHIIDQKPFFPLQYWSLDCPSLKEVP